ncbi:MAG TPA: ribose-5-phosphate isomerase RpiA [Gemmataceae bacterium]|nr:ribose-5-phosphate isomerase RpiA [Gemmataceae bacterium]
MTDDFAALAARALELVPDGSRIGLGSGRTAAAFTRALGERVRQGLRVRAVPTSEAAGRLAAEVGIPLDTLDAAEPLEVTIDGADEVERATLNLIKGWGGALVRERVVAAASRRQVILITGAKLVDRLGQRGRLPVEVLPFAAPFCRRRIEQLAVPGGLRPVLRLSNGQPFVTDNGNWILDCALAPPEEPAALERTLRAIPGVVDCGLFLGTAALVLVAEGGAVHELRRSADSRSVP